MKKTKAVSVSIAGRVKAPGTSIPIETGRYLITAQLQGAAYSKPQQAPRVFISRLQRDEHGGWLTFYCTFRGGAIGLLIKSVTSLTNNNKPAWVCQDQFWIILDVRMITIEQYLSELENLNVHTQDAKKRK